MNSSGGSNNVEEPTETDYLIDEDQDETSKTSMWVFLGICLLAVVLLAIGIPIGYKETESANTPPPTPPPTPTPPPPSIPTPTFAPTTAAPTPSAVPTFAPTFTVAPSAPTFAPTFANTNAPTTAPTQAPVPPTNAPTAAPTMAPTPAPFCEDLIQTPQPCFDTENCTLYLRRQELFFVNTDAVSLYGGTPPRALTIGLPPNDELFQATPTLEAPILLPEGTRVEFPDVEDATLHQFYLIEKVNGTFNPNVSFFGQAQIRVRQIASNPQNTLIGQPEMVVAIMICYDYEGDGIGPTPEVHWDWCTTCEVEVFISLDPQILSCLMEFKNQESFFNVTQTRNQVEARTGVRPYDDPILCGNIGLYMWVSEHPNANIGALYISLNSNEAQAAYSRIRPYFTIDCAQNFLPYRDLGTQVYLRESTRFSQQDFDFPVRGAITPSSTVPEDMALTAAPPNTTQTRLIEVRRDVTTTISDPRDQVVESRVQFLRRGVNLTNFNGNGWARIDVFVEETDTVNRASIGLQSEVDVDNDGIPEYQSVCIFNILANLTVFPLACDLEYRTYQLWPTVAYDFGDEMLGDLVNVTLGFWVWVASTTVQLGGGGIPLPPANVSVVFDTPGSYSTQKEPLAAVFNPGWDVVEFSQPINNASQKMFLIGNANETSFGGQKTNMFNYTIGTDVPFNLPDYSDAVFQVPIRTGVMLGANGAYSWTEPLDQCQMYGQDLIGALSNVPTGGLRWGFPINNAGNFTNEPYQNGITRADSTVNTVCSPATNMGTVPLPTISGAYNLRRSLVTFNYLNWIDTSQTGFPIPGDDFEAFGVSPEYGFQIKVQRNPVAPSPGSITHLCAFIYSGRATAGQVCSGPNCNPSSCPPGAPLLDCIPNVLLRSSFGCSYDLSAVADGDNVTLICDHEEGASTIPPSLGQYETHQDMSFNSPPDLDNGVDPWFTQLVVSGCEGVLDGQPGINPAILEPPPGIEDAWQIYVNTEESFFFPGVTFFEPNTAT